MLTNLQEERDSTRKRYLRASRVESLAEKEALDVGKRVLESELHHPSQLACQKRLTVRQGKILVYCHVTFQSTPPTTPEGYRVQELLVTT